MELVDAGQLGKKTGRGFYDWVNGKPQKSAPGAVPAGLADRLVDPYVAEAKAALAEGIVADADLVDAGAIFGTGFAPFRGGPLHYAASAARMRGRGDSVRDPPGGAASAHAWRTTSIRCANARTSRRARAPDASRAADGGSRHSGRSVVEKIWLKHYPKGVPAEIDVNEYASVREVFEESVAQVRGAARVHVHGQVDHVRRARHAVGGVRRLAAGRTAARKGTRVALMMPNILQYPVCLFGTLRAGCTVVNVNPLYTARELEHQLNDSGAEVIVVVENFAHTLQEVVGKTQGASRSIVTSIGELLGFKGLLVDFVLRHVKKMVPAWSLPGSIRLSDALAEGRKRTLERVPLGHDDIAFLQYTGGTTGVAKGAMLLHRNIVANLLQARAWVRPFLDAEAARDHHHAAAALSHLLADGELPRVHDARRARTC